MKKCLLGSLAFPSIPPDPIAGQHFIQVTRNYSRWILYPRRLVSLPLQPKQQRPCTSSARGGRMHRGAYTNYWTISNEQVCSCMLTSFGSSDAPVLSGRGVLSDDSLSWTPVLLHVATWSKMASSLETGPKKVLRKHRRRRSFCTSCGRQRLSSIAFKNFWISCYKTATWKPVSTAKGD